MKAYKIEAKKGDVVFATRYAGTAALSKSTRDELVESFDLKKKDVSISDYEIPTSKAELLEFVNTLAAAADLQEDEQ